MALVDRQTLMFFIIMFIFLSLPNGGDQIHSSKDREVLDRYQQQLLNNRKELQNSKYYTGYGNLTGLKVSYQDLLQGKNELLWPIHEFSRKHPWIEDEKFSLLPNEISGDIKSFWANEPVQENDPNAYLLNISGKSYGEFEVDTPKKLLKFSFRLPQYLQDHYDSYTQLKYQQDKERYDQDPENNEPPQPPADGEKSGNITFNSGKISLTIKALDYNYLDRDMSKVVNKKDAIDDAVVVNLKINLLDYPEISDNELDTIGIYFQKTGSLVSVTRSAKFSGSQGLPHFAMSEEFFNKSALLMGQVMNMTDVVREITMDDMNSNIQNAVSQCEYINYFQLERTEYLEQQLRDIDDELKSPSGRPLPEDIPTINIKQSLLYSPDCGIVVKSKQNKDFVGNKAEVTSIKLKHMLTGFLFLSVAQLFLLIRQIKEIRTPGQLSNVSTGTIGIISFQDSLVAILFLLVSNLLESLYLLLACVAVVAFLMSGVFELRFLVSALTAQANERGTTWWEILRGGSRNEETRTSEEGLPLPVTAGQPGSQNATTPTATTEPVVNDEARFANTIFGTGCALTIISMFLILNSLLWRVKFRRIFEYVGLIAINSYWIPQFMRNTLKNRRRAFLWTFILGSSAIRSAPICYLCLNAENPLRHHYDGVLAACVTGWISVQLLLLYLQQVWGPRFWIKDKWLPQAYDYHYMLNIKDLERGGGVTSDLLSSVSATVSDTPNGIVTCKVDCAICMNDVELPVNTHVDGKTVGSIDKSICKKYMITPCQHVFHTECLSDWMVYKLQCPVCRTGLPPV